MRALLLGAGIAALALGAPLAAFGPGGGHGGGGGNGGDHGGPPGGGGGPPGGGGGKGGGGGGGPPADRGGGHGGGHGGGGPQMERGGGGPQRAERGPDRGPQRAERAQRGPDRGPGEMRGRGQERQAQRGPEQRGPEQRGAPQRPERQSERGPGPRGFERRGNPAEAYRGPDRGGPAYRDGPTPVYAGAPDRRDPRAFYGNPVQVDGCPPGLAAKNNGCLPPGQAKKWVGQRAPAILATSLLPVAYRSWYPDNNDYYYREQDGLIYRVARSSNIVDGYAPLFGYGPDYYPDYYYAGEPYPSDYVSFYNVPLPYQRYYADSGNDLYRYGDGGIYQVNRSNGVVEQIAALFAGDLAMGQPLPAGYDVYNVPYQYRDRYADNANDWYRYNDGYIYQVDPKTRLITAVIEALV